MKRFGSFSNFIVGVVLLLAGLYYLYSKGIILADFESVKPAVAYEMIKKDPDIVILDVRTEQEYRGLVSWSHTKRGRFSSTAGAAIAA